MGDEDDTSGEVGDAVEAVGDGVEAAGKAADLAQKASEGDVAGAVQSGLGAAGGAAGIVRGALGEEEGEAREALQTAGAVAGAASALVGVGSSLAGGDVDGAVGGLGGATGAAQNIVPDNEVASVLGGVSQASAAAQQAASQLGSLAQGMSGRGGHDDVEPHLEVVGADDIWRVTSFTINESLNTVPTATVRAHYAGFVDVSELLHAECSLFIERRQSEQARAFKGVVLHATVHPVREDIGGVDVTLRFSPAVALLGFRVDSRIHQEVTVVEAIEATFNDMLSSLGRSIRVSDLTRTYETREYLVQYQESHLHFLRRLCEDEGISFFFEHDDDHEVMVLADSVESFAAAREDDDGEVEYHASPGVGRGNEFATDLHYFQEVGATDAVVGDYDWTNPSLVIKADKTGRGEHEPPLEVYDHTDAQIFHEYSGGQYGNNTAKIQARLRTERLDLRRQRWEMASNVVTALAGRTLVVSGHPDASLDQRYAILASSVHGSRSSQGGRCSFSAQHQLAPASMPYRPPRTTTPPLIHGPLLATVVGPSGEEIHTDEHGRVRVYFAWDRYHEAKAEDSSCWMRVTQSWAGPGFGTFFLPRIGMEVVVNFMGGNPDRPLITGCVYNGTNRAGMELDAKKTQSLIRTKSSPNSDGYNEMRFEDEAGNEFINVHAQKDYNETVLNNHSTTVHANQTNTVDKDQTEHVKGEQTMTVDKNRTVHILGSQDVTIDGGEENAGVTGSKLKITGDYKVDVSDWIEIEAPTHIRLTCEGSVIEITPGKITLSAGDGAELVLDANALMHSKADTAVLLDADARMSASTGGELVMTSDVDLHSKAGSQVLLDGAAKMVSSDSAHVELTSNASMSGVEASVTGSSEAEMSAPTAKLSGAGGSVEASSSGVDAAGGSVNITGDGLVNVAASVVKIN